MSEVRVIGISKPSMSIFSTKRERKKEKGGRRTGNGERKLSANTDTNLSCSGIN